MFLHVFLIGVLLGVCSAEKFTHCITPDRKVYQAGKWPCNNDVCHSRVAFHVTRTYAMGPVSHPTIVEFDDVITNVGHSFDKESTRFYAPLSGVYHFEFSVASSAKKGAKVYLKESNRRKAEVYSPAGYYTSSSQTILTLARGQQVYLELEEKMFQLYSSEDNPLVTFGGHLLYPLPEGAGRFQCIIGVNPEPGVPKQHRQLDEDPLQ